MKKTMTMIAITLMAQLAFAGGSSSSGLGNPASIFCRKIGGDLNIIDTPEGQVGICTIEEWVLFNYAQNDGLELTEDKTAMGLANPASVFCREIGGELVIIDTTQVGMCSIEDTKLWAAFGFPVLY